MAGAHEFRQHGFHARQVGHLLAHVLELVFGQAAGLLAVGAIVEPQQLGNLVQTEPQPLCRFHEFHPNHVRLPIAADAAVRLVRFSQYEGLFISRLLPLFAALAFLANALGWFSHRQWLRSLLGMIGPAIVFAATVWLLGNWWTANLMYVGLALMIGVSIWDFVSPAHRRCGPDGCELPAKRL